MTNGPVAVTGATGFLGRRLVKALLAEGFSVRALIRGPGDRAGGWDGGVAPEIVRGDLGDPSALEALATGAVALIHGAGLIKARSRADFFATNADGARRVAEAAARARLPGPTILISSLAAREPALSDYAASKRMGESVAREVLGDGLSIARPPAIYGPGDRETLGLFQLAGSSPILPTPEAPDARLALAHVDDVAAELIAVLRSGLAGDGAPALFGVGGGRPAGYGWREIFGAAAAAMGRTPKFASLPGWLITGASRISGAVAQARGAPVIFTPGKARELLHPDWSFSEAELAPPSLRSGRDLDAGFRETVAWYRREGWLPSR